MTKMIIAISQRNGKTKNGSWDLLENNYVAYYEKFGIILLPIPNVTINLKSYFDTTKINGIILSGGGDVNPSNYDGLVIEGDYSKERDETEKKLIKIAIKEKIPLFAQCRGSQLLNVFFGGQIMQNIKEKYKSNHVGVNHYISIVDKKASDFLGRNRFIVNSYHNHGIDEDSLSNQFKVFAISNDGLIEGFYHPNYPIAGVLWHPERNGSDKKMNKKLIRAFLDRKLFWK